MVRRAYSSIAQRTSLSASVNNSTTTIPVVATTGFPSTYPYTIILDPDTTSEECCEVTSAAGLNLTVTRGIDGTSAVTHNTPCVVQHGFSARDFDDANKFINIADLNTQTGNYTAVITDTGKVIEMNVASANTFTIPPNASVAFPVGSTFDVVQVGGGQTTITPGAGVTLLSYGSNFKLTGQYSACTCYQRSANSWVVTGDLSP
jgi:hypothetical protein